MEEWREGRGGKHREGGGSTNSGVRAGAVQLLIQALGSHAVFEQSQPFVEFWGADPVGGWGVRLMGSLIRSLDGFIAPQFTVASSTCSVCNFIKWFW